MKEEEHNIKPILIYKAKIFSKRGVRKAFLPNGKNHSKYLRAKRSIIQRLKIAEANV